MWLSLKGVVYHMLIANVYTVEIQCCHHIEIEWIFLK